MADNYFTIIAKINDGKDEVFLTPNAITSISYTFSNVIPKNIVEEGFEVSDTVINKEAMINVSAVISDARAADVDNGFLDTTTFLNTLKSIRDSKTPFVVVGGKQGVEHHKHDKCLFESYKQTQNVKHGVTQAGTASYKLDFTISAIRVADSAIVTSISEEFADALADLNSREAQGVVSQFPLVEEEAIRLAVRRDNIAPRASQGLEKDVRRIYDDLLAEAKKEATGDRRRAARVKAAASRKQGKLQGSQDRVSFHTDKLERYLRGS